MHAAGLTLVELLVALAILSLLVLLVSQFFTQGSSVSMSSSSRAELQQEVLNAQQLMASNLKDAWFVYPSGSSITMTTTSLTQKPTGGNTWVVGTDPIAAMFLLPENPGVSCATNSAGCFRFRAYYPVRRSVWVQGTADSSWRNPGANPLNDNRTWVLAEYRANVELNAATVAAANAGTAPGVPTGATANLLADYIAPTNVSGATYTMFDYADDGRSLTISLAVTQQVGSQVLRLPDKTGTYDITASFNNIGKLLRP
ncbi:prepilin-type N-terminal cleavage/methylation domain-containing protein [Deinococcus piscis]|uniref:prepilin-type N-terminal cleavage/methylation domain-containing protein n=1 Tax=Deinococcus piscis TaxID=394230 RepID=UPI001E47BCAE|nr:prepilin-type N-terminal cleavage/methylation domain-containing protein [Deinococcus piscis]